MSNDIIFEPGDRVTCVQGALRERLLFSSDYVITDTSVNTFGDQFVLVEGLEEWFIASRFAAANTNGIDGNSDGHADGTAAGAILRDAADIVEGVRSTTHGDKERSFEVIAGLWNVYLRGRSIDPGLSNITASEVCVMMALLKIARSAFNGSVRDHYVDGAGYLGVAGELAHVK